MKIATAFSLAIRLVALMLGIRAIGYLQWLGLALERLFNRPQSWPHLVANITALTFSLVVAWLLFRHADVIAAKFIGSHDDINMGQCDELLVRQNIFRLAMKIIGTVCVVFSIPKIIIGLGTLTVLIGDPSFRVGTSSWQLLTLGIITFGIGIYLLKGGKLLMRIAYGQKTAGPASE